MFVITVKFTTHEKDTEKFKARIVQQARDSLELEKDCHVFDVCHDPNNNNVVFLYEIYKFISITVVIVLMFSPVFSFASFPVSSDTTQI